MSQVRYILQVRTNSSRLPAKALLPVGGMPSAVLAAHRAGRNGADLVVATSSTTCDDFLAETLQNAGLNIFRGELDDVLGRFVAACNDLPDEAIVVRLTADNMFPDPDFIEPIVEALIACPELDYIVTSSPRDGLPYGLSVEVVCLGALRQADIEADVELDRAHVTPWIIRNRPGRIYTDLAAEVGLQHLRCTVDILDDYQRIANVFLGLTDPVKVHWRVLCERLAAMPGAPRESIPWRSLRSGGTGPEALGEMVLGTAQLGLDYGITNRHGMPDESTAIALVRHAIDHGIDTLDTASRYGVAEERLGRALADGWHSRARVITKLPLPNPEKQSTDCEVAASYVDAHIFRSCRNLGLQSLDTVLLHEARPLKSDDDPYWHRLKELQEEKLIKYLGVSIESLNDLHIAIADPHINHIQLPFSLLDYRWLDGGAPLLLAQRPDITVHARSIFLQGLLAGKGWNIFRSGGQVNITAWKRPLEKLVQELRCEGIADLCIAFVRAHTWVDGLVIGVETVEQLEEDIALFSRSPLNSDQVEMVRAGIPRLPEHLLNPSNWN